MRDVISEVLDKAITVEAFIDSMTVFDTGERDGKSSERRLKLDIHALREYNMREELEKIFGCVGRTTPQIRALRPIGRKSR